MTMTRVAAINEFGLTATYRGHLLVFGYLEKFKTQSILEQLTRVTENFSPCLRLEEGIADTTAESSKYNSGAVQSRIPAAFDFWLSHSFDAQPKDFSNATMEKKLKDLVRLNLVNHLVSHHENTWFEKRMAPETLREHLIEKYASNPVVMQYVDGINVHKEWLSDALEIGRFLPMNTTLYGVMPFAISRSTNVLEFNVVSRQVEKNKDGTYRVKHIVKSNSPDYSTGEFFTSDAFNSAVIMHDGSSIDMYEERESAFAKAIDNLAQVMAMVAQSETNLAGGPK